MVSMLADVKMQQAQAMLERARSPSPPPPAAAPQAVEELVPRTPAPPPPPLSFNPNIPQTMTDVAASRPVVPDAITALLQAAAAAQTMNTQQPRAVSPVAASHHPPPAVTMPVPHQAMSHYIQPSYTPFTQQAPQLPIVPTLPTGGLGVEPITYVTQLDGSVVGYATIPAPVQPPLQPQIVYVQPQYAMPHKRHRSKSSSHRR
jgi:hypothetical protein